VAFLSCHVALLFIPVFHKGLVVEYLHIFEGKASAVVQGTAEDLNAYLSDDDDDDSCSPPLERASNAVASEKRSEGRKSLVQGEITETITDREKQTISIIKELEDGKTMR
jgi:hypothetical protein